LRPPGFCMGGAAALLLLLLRVAAGTCRDGVFATSRRQSAMDGNVRWMHAVSTCSAFCWPSLQKHQMHRRTEAGGGDGVVGGAVPFAGFKSAARKLSATGSAARGRDAALPPSSGRSCRLPRETELLARLVSLPASLSARLLGRLSAGGGGMSCPEVGEGLPLTPTPRKGRWLAGES